MPLWHYWQMILCLDVTLPHTPVSEYLYLIIIEHVKMIDTMTRMV